jgi:hypothetical protein
LEEGMPCSFGAALAARMFPRLVPASRHTFGIAVLPIAAAMVLSASTVPTLADDEFYELETKYIFGFTVGSGIGLEGEREVSSETIAGFGRRGGSYKASETKLEFEYTPNQYIQIELGPLVSSHNIRDVNDLDNRNQVAFAGAFGELRYLAIERGPSSPFAVTVSVEPTTRRIDDTSGQKVRNFELETKIAADTELIPNRLYLGFNALYEPEWSRTAAGEFEREATIGFSSALAWRPLPALVIGAEVGYFRHYDSTGLSAFVGDALYVGPTLYYRISRKTFMTAAWGTQVAGHSTEVPGTLNLTDFSRHRAKLKMAVEF